ncbi:MAG: Ig-like domain-containing protein [Gemmatimonadales bacterium]
MLRLLLTPSNWPAATSLLVSLLLLGGCGGGEGIILPGDGEPAAIAVTDGDGQRGRVREPLTDPLVVQVTDSRGRPVEGATVAFELTSAGSEVVPAQKSTNADGKADARLVLGTTFGRQTGNARVVTQEGRPAVQTDFTAMALPEDANTMAAVAGQDQSGHVNTQLDERLVVRVTDRFENPVEGVPITWVAEGGGSVSAEVVETDQDGESRVRRTLGPTVGTQTTVASSEGLAGSPVTFVHTALAGDASRLVVVSGNGQTAPVGSALPADLVVALLDADGNGIPATAVSWVVATGGGRANPENSTTNGDGRTSARWTLGDAAGEQRLDAVVSGVGVASFRATATSPVIGTTTTITADSPDPSVAGSEFLVEFRVTSGGPTPTGTVRVTVSGGPATCTATLSGGVGSCSLRLGGLGDRTITATYSGAPGLSGSSDTEPHRVEPAQPANETPTADFNWHCEDLTCFFTDHSRDDDGTITNRHWDFGDGATTENELTPSHTYVAGGDHTVILTVTDNGGLTDEAQDKVNPKAPPPPNQAPTAEFTWQCNELKCAFSDASTDGDGRIESRAWDFGDGNTSDRRDPDHSYGAGGTYTVTLTVTDNDGAQGGPVSHPITVAAPNAAPQGQGDSYTTSEDTQLTVNAPGVLGNDSDPNGDGLTAVNASGPSNGTVTLSSNGSFVYTPDPNFNGNDSFTYRASDGSLQSGPVTVTVSVSAVNDPPVAGDDSYTMFASDPALTVSAAGGVLSNDSDPDAGTTLTAQIGNTLPSQGTVNLSADGSFTYTPNPGATGTDSFTYTASDGGLTSNAAVTITIQ